VRYLLRKVISLDLIDLESLRNTPIYEVLRDYLSVNKMSIQNIDSLDNYYNILERLKKCIEDVDFELGGKLIWLAEIMLKIESEKLLLKCMDEDARDHYLVNKSKWYRMEIQSVIDDAVLSMLSRNKDTIVVDVSESEEPESILGLSNLNCRRDVTDEDFRNLIGDEIAFEDLMAGRRESEHLKRESLSTSVMVDFDMENIMDKLRSHMRRGIEEDLSNIDMDYIDAFVAALHLNTMGEISVRQVEFGSPIYVRMA